MRGVREVRDALGTIKSSKKFSDGDGGWVAGWLKSNIVSVPIPL